jgi:hypothetical protein
LSCFVRLQCKLTARRYVLVGVTRRKHRAGSWYFSHKFVTVQGGFGVCFCRPGTNFIEHYACRGTKFDRSREFITGYKICWEHWRSVALQGRSKPENCQGILDFNCGQMYVSGCKNHYESVLVAGTPACRQARKQKV